jgi:hypothetical protein
MEQQAHIQKLKRAERAQVIQEILNKRNPDKSPKKRSYLKKQRPALTSPKKTKPKTLKIRTQSPVLDLVSPPPKSRSRLASSNSHLFKYPDHSPFPSSIYLDEWATSFMGLHTKRKKVFSF